MTDETENRSAITSLKSLAERCRAAVAHDARLRERDSTSEKYAAHYLPVLKAEAEKAAKLLDEIDAIIAAPSSIEAPKCEDCGFTQIRGELDRSGQSWWCPVCAKAGIRMAENKRLRAELEAAKSSTGRAPETPRWTDAAEAAFEKWWQSWREANGYTNTQRMRETARAVYVEIAYSPLTAAVENLAAEGNLANCSASVASLSDAERACIDIFRDFDEDEVRQETTSVRSAWEVGKVADRRSA